MAFKLKVPKLDWRGKALKLQKIVLSGAPLVEVDHDVLEMFDIMRKVMRGEISPEEPPPSMPQGGVPQNLMWEPYSDVRGKEESIYGWNLRATLYCADGKPWWLVRADNKLDEPSVRSVAELERVVDYLGADAQRDRIMSMSFGEGRGCVMWWTWINQHPLLEMQLHPQTHDMRIVQESSPLPSGYMRIERAHK